MDGVKALLTKGRLTGRGEDIKYCIGYILEFPCGLRIFTPPGIMKLDGDMIGVSSEGQMINH